MSNHGSPVALLKFQMPPYAYARNILRHQEKGAQTRASEFLSQGWWYSSIISELSV